MSEDFTGGWSGSSSIITPRSSILDPRSSGKNTATGTVLKMAQTNQLPVIPRPRSEEIKNKRSEMQPGSVTSNLFLNGVLIEVLIVFLKTSYLCVLQSVLPIIGPATRDKWDTDMSLVLFYFIIAFIVIYNS